MKTAQSAIGPLGLAILFLMAGVALAQEPPEVRRARPVDEPPVARALPVEEPRMPRLPAEDLSEPAARMLIAEYCRISGVEASIIVRW